MCKLGYYIAIISPILLLFVLNYLIYPPVPFPHTSSTYFIVYTHCLFWNGTPGMNCIHGAVFVLIALYFQHDTCDVTAVFTLEHVTRADIYVQELFSLCLQPWPIFSTYESCCDATRAQLCVDGLLVVDYVYQIYYAISPCTSPPTSNCWEDIPQLLIATFTIAVLLASFFLLLLLWRGCLWRIISSVFFQLSVPLFLLRWRR